jgi:hypothetical protein
MLGGLAFYTGDKPFPHIHLAIENINGYSEGLKFPTSEARKSQNRISEPNAYHSAC